MNRVLKYLCLFILLVSVSSCNSEKTISFRLINGTNYFLKDVTIRAGCKDREGIITVSLKPHERSEIQNLKYKGCGAEFFSEPMVKGGISKVLTNSNQEIDLVGSWLKGRYDLEQNTINEIKIMLDSTGNKLIYVLMD